MVSPSSGDVTRLAEKRAATLLPVYLNCGRFRSLPSASGNARGRSTAQNHSRNGMNDKRRGEGGEGKRERGGGGKDRKRDREGEKRDRAREIGREKTKHCREQVLIVDRRCGVNPRKARAGWDDHLHQKRPQEDIILSMDYSITSRHRHGERVQSRLGCEGQAAWGDESCRRNRIGSGRERARRLNKILSPKGQPQNVNSIGVGKGKKKVDPEEEKGDKKKG